jgi:hypothetical protein
LGLAAMQDIHMSTWRYRQSDKMKDRWLHNFDNILMIMKEKMKNVLEFVKIAIKDIHMSR